MHFFLKLPKVNFLSISQTSFIFHSYFIYSILFFTYGHWLFLFLKTCNIFMEKLVSWRATKLIGIFTCLSETHAKIGALYTMKLNKIFILLPSALQQQQWQRDRDHFKKVNMRRNIPDNSSQYTTFIHFMPTFLSGRVCCGQDYPGGSAVKNPPAMQEPQETMFSPWVGKSPGEHGNPLQYSCLENPIDRGVWWVKELNTTEAT